MLLVGRKLFAAYLISSFLAQIFMAVFYYNQLAGKELQATHVTHIAESLLFVNLVLSVVFLVIGISVPLYSRSVDRELDKLGDASERGNYNAGRATYNLGQLGGRINRIVRQVSTISELRRQHIISLTHLIQLCSDAADSVYFICDLEGKVKFISRGARDFYKIKPPSVENAEVNPDIVVENILPDIHYTTLIKKFNRRSPWLSENGLTIYAALDDKDIPHYIFFTPEQSKISSILKEKLSHFLKNDESTRSRRLKALLPHNPR